MCFLFCLIEDSRIIIVLFVLFRLVEDSRIIIIIIIILFV